MWTIVNLDSYQNTQLTIEVINKSLIQSFSTEASKYFSSIVGLKMTKEHTAGLDTIFVQIYMDALPGVPEVSKNQIFFYK